MNAARVSSEHSNSANLELRLSVEQFFRCNWDNHPPNVQGSSPLRCEMLTVQQFLSAISWEGMPIAASATPASSDFVAPNAFTLDDFSNLF